MPFTQQPQSQKCNFLSSSGSSAHSAHNAANPPVLSMQQAPEVDPVNSSLTLSPMHNSIQSLPNPSLPQHSFPQREDPSSSYNIPEQNPTNRSPSYLTPLTQFPENGVQQSKRTLQLQSSSVQQHLSLPHPISYNVSQSSQPSQQCPPIPSYTATETLQGQKFASTHHFQLQHTSPGTPLSTYNTNSQLETQDHSESPMTSQPNPNNLGSKPLSHVSSQGQQEDVRSKPAVSASQRQEKVQLKRTSNTESEAHRTGGQHNIIQPPSTAPCSEYQMQKSNQSQATTPAVVPQPRKKRQSKAQSLEIKKKRQHSQKSKSTLNSQLQSTAKYVQKYKLTPQNSSSPTPISPPPSPSTFIPLEQSQPSVFRPPTQNRQNSTSPGTSSVVGNGSSKPHGASTVETAQVRKSRIHSATPAQPITIQQQPIANNSIIDNGHLVTAINRQCALLTRMNNSLDTVVSTLKDGNSGQSTIRIEAATHVATIKAAIEASTEQYVEEVKQIRTAIEEADGVNASENNEESLKLVSYFEFFNSYVNA